MRLNTVMKKYRDIEKITKGIANHRRIEIMDLLSKKPGLSLQDIAESLKINLKTASSHVKRLNISDLVWKTSDDKFVKHHLSPQGKVILTFLRTLE